MGLLSEELFRAGLLSEADFRRQQTDEESDREERQRSQLRVGGSKTWADLDSCATPREFKGAAKQILLQDPAQIKEVINRAHRFKRDRKFIWFFYQVRDGLNGLDPEKIEQFLNRAFRRVGATFEIPK